MENNKNEIMELENQEIMETSNDAYETSGNSGSGSGLIVGGLALLAAAGVGTVALLRKKGKLPSREERMIKKLEKAGYRVEYDDFDDDFFDEELTDDENIIDEEPKKSTRKKTTKKTEEQEQ